MKAALKKADKGKLWDWLDDGDGHGILKPDYYTNVLGLPENFVKKHTRTIKSDLSSPKTTIFGPNGEIIHSMIAVYNLEILQGFAKEIGADTSSGREFLGRGRIARALGEACIKKLQKDKILPKKRPSKKKSVLMEGK